jgi:hypothetical protein
MEAEAKTPMPPILNIRMVPAGIELVIGALRKLPHEQVDDLVQELWAQYKNQMNAMAEAAMHKSVQTEQVSESSTEN